MTDQAAGKTKEDQGVTTGKDPVIALVLTFVCPGLGHVYLRKYSRALIYFAVLSLIYLVGIRLSGPTVFALSGAGEAAASGSKWLLILLTPIPEAFHCVGTLASSYLYLQGAIIIVPGDFPLAAVGYSLTALGGLLNLFVMCDAWTVASDPPIEDPYRPARSALLSWAVPGLGHILLGQRFKGWFCFAFINGLYFLGVFLGSGLVVNREKFFYYWSAQLLNGGATLITSIFTQGWRKTEALAYDELGLLYTTVAGLLNVLVILSAYNAALGRKP